jgi:hypothetical protein
MKQIVKFWAYGAFVATCVAGWMFTPSSQPAGDNNRDELARRCLAAGHRVQSRYRTARDVIDGRLSLLQAAEHYRDVSEAAADFDWDEFRKRTSAASDDERYCRLVMKFVHALLERENQSQAQSFQTRLETELASMRDGGRLRLRR